MPKVRSDDVHRIKELEAELQREDKALVGLKAQTAGLEAKATSLQLKIDGAGMLLHLLSISSYILQAELWEPCMRLKGVCIILSHKSSNRW